MIDIETMIKALRLASIPRLLKTANLDWKTLPDHHFKKYGGFKFLLKCNYRMKEFKDIMRFYRDILLFFDELKSLYDDSNNHDLILFNNKEILIGAKPFILQEWLNKGVRTVMDILDSEGNFMSFAALKSKFKLRNSSFLHFYQVKSAIPSHLLVRARELLAIAENDNDVSVSFSINANSFLDLEKAKAKDFYWLLVNKTHTHSHAGPKRWEKRLLLKTLTGRKLFKWCAKSLKKTKCENFILK